MDERKDIEVASGESAKNEAKKRELPTVESPSISPAKSESETEPVAAAEPSRDLVTIAAVPEAGIGPAPEPATPPRFILRPRHKRHALLAASVAIAAAFGAVIGATATGSFGTPSPQTTIAAADERKAMEQSISRLAKEVTTLKTSLDTANKAAHAQFAKISERIERNASAELITGSISPPQTVAPLPTPRPAPRVAAVETQMPARQAVLQDWSIRDMRDGFVYVQGHGDIYQVVRGAPLPGLGPVESVTQRDGRWVVTTPKGIIVSLRDRHYFE
jgi:hypothetical protein